MDAPLTVDEYLDVLVFLHCGMSDEFTKRVFRNSLLVLVELSKAEEIADLGFEYVGTHGNVRHVIH